MKDIPDNEWEKKLALFIFHCIFEFFGPREVHSAKKRKKHACKFVLFLPLRSELFELFSTCLDMSRVGVGVKKF